MLLKSLKDKIMTSSFISLDIKLTVTAIQSIRTQQVFSHAQLSCFMSTLQFKCYMFAFEEICFTNLPLMSNIQYENVSFSDQSALYQPGLSCKRQGTFLSKKEESIPV